MNSPLCPARLLPLVVLVATSHTVRATDLKLEPQVSLGISTTDNVLLESREKTGSTILNAVAGAHLSAEGEQSSLSLDYRVTQASFSHDSGANKLSHQLQLAAQKASTRTGWQANLSGGIRNVPRAIGRNASVDLMLGDLVESRQLQAGVGYSNDSRGPIAVSVNASSNVQHSEDGLGDSVSHTVMAQLGQGRLVKGSFWNLNYSLSRRNSGQTSRTTNAQTMGYQTGFELYEKWSPLISAYMEKYTQSDDNSALEREQRMVRLGPGIRYNLSKQSHIQLSYDTVMDGPQDDSWGVDLLWQPSRRTKLTFNYGVRYFGESYEFSLSHKNKRWTNTIRYTEGPESFSREYFIDEENIEDLALTRTLTWSSSLNLERNTLSFSANARLRDPGALVVNSSGNSNDVYGGSLSVKRELSPETSLSLALNYNQYSFGQSLEQKDKYYTVKAAMEHELMRQLSLNYGAHLVSRNSSRADYAYDESRLFLNLKKSF